MGGVFLAEDMQLDRRVALKIMRPEFASRPGATERFLREAKAVAAVHDEHIVTIYQVGQATIPGQAQAIPFLAQELLSGETLEQKLKRDGRLSVDEAVSIGRQIALGLAAAHERGLIHRDIKPANVWLEQSREESGQSRAGQAGANALALDSCHSTLDSPRVKLLDFGLARAVGDTANLTQSGMILGTPAYMAPEQARGETVDARADLFSLGCVLYRMLTGQSAFGGKDVLAILTSLATVTPPAVKSIRDDVPDELSELIDQLLAKERNARPVSASDVARRLATLGRPALETRVDRNAGRPRSAILRIALGLAACALFGVIVITLKDKDGKVTKITVDTPPGTTLVSVKQDSDNDDGQVARREVPQQDFLTLDKLNPKHIPDTERVLAQPDELVAVIGEHRPSHWSGIKSIAFHPSGELFASRCDRNDIQQLRIWSAKSLVSANDSTDFEVWRQFQGSGIPCFSPDGSSLWAGNTSATIERVDDGTPRLRLSGGRPLHKVRDYATAVISPDGRWQAVTGSPQGILEIWDISKATARLAKEVSFPAKSYSTKLMLSKDGRRLMTNSLGEGELFLWDVDWSAEGGPAVTPFGEPIKASNFALSSDGQRVATDGQEKSIVRVLDLTQSPPRVEFEATDSHSPFALSADGTRLVSMSGGSSIRLHERLGTTWEKRFQLANAQAGLTTMTISPDGRTLVAGDLGGHIRVWDLSAAPPAERNPAPPASRVQKLAFSPDGRYLAVQGWDGGTVWDLTGEIPAQLNFTEPTGQPYFAPSFSPDSRLVAFKGGVWNLKPQAPTKILGRPYADIRLSPFDNTIVSFLDTDQLQFEEWAVTEKGTFRTTGKTSQWKPVRSPAKPAAVFDGLGRLQFACRRTVIDDGQGNIEVWNIDDDTKPIITVKFANPFGYCLSPRGDLLFVWNNVFGAAWDLQNAPPTESRFHTTGETTAACFNSTGEQIIAADGRGIAIYDWKHRREKRRIDFPGSVLFLALHPDGRHLATANGNGTVYILRLPELAK